MKHPIQGIPWTQEEVDTLKLALKEEWLMPEIFRALGNKRTVGAIERKILRLVATKSIKKIETPKPKKSNTKWVTGKLDLIKSRPTKFIMLNDVHVPHNIDLTYIWEFAQDFKPDYMLLVGDIVNNDPFDHWAKKKPRSFKTMPQPKEYYEQCNKEFYRPLRAAVGPECKIVHWIGNHEYWSNKAISDMPEGEGYWEVENNVENVDMWVPSKQIANLGKLHFIHGDVIQSSRNAAAKAMNVYRRNLRLGHFHSLEESSHTSPIDIEDRHTTRVCGCLEKSNPDFMGNRPHDWISAFTYGRVLPDGNFMDHTTTVVNDRFMADGKIYGE